MEKGGMPAFGFVGAAARWKMRRETRQGDCAQDLGIYVMGAGMLQTERENGMSWRGEECGEE